MASEIEITPVRSEMRDPYRMRVNRSRRKTWVRKRWWRLGGWSRSSGCVVRGSYPVSSGAPTAARIRTTRIIPPSTAPRERASRTSTSRHGERRGREWGAGPASLEPDAGVEGGIGDIHQQIHHDVHDRDEQHGSLHQRENLVKDGGHQQPADARTGKDRLCNDRAREQRSEL